MKWFFILVSFPMIIFGQNIAPANYTLDTIKPGENGQRFLKLKNKVASNYAMYYWDIALYNELHEIGGKVNEQVGAKLWRVYRDSTQFSSLSFTDTTSPVFNDEKFMYYGALDTVYTGTLASYFQIGCGKYFNDDHTVIGSNRMYILRSISGEFYKYFVRKYVIEGTPSQRNYYIRVAKIDNSFDTSIVVSKTTELKNHYSYIQFSGKNIISEPNQEPEMKNWDLNFRKYYTTNGGSRVESPAIGVYTNNAYNMIRYSKILGGISDALPDVYLKYGVTSTEVYEASGNVSTVVYDNSLNTLEPISRFYNQIGVKWYDATNNTPKSNVSYFLRDMTGDVWHIIFTQCFSNCKEVEIGYNKIGNFGSIKQNSVKDYSISQLEGKLIIESQNKLSTKQVRVFDMSGRIINQFEFKQNGELELKSIPKSILIVQILDNNQLTSHKLIVE